MKTKVCVIGIGYVGLPIFLNLSKSNNLIDILNFIKDERFVEETSNIKLNYENKEVLIFTENFLLVWQN